jgi:hypothetical protein
LAEAVLDSKKDILADLEREKPSNSSRRITALQLVLNNMDMLEKHMKRSRRILNDLRSMRRLLFDERKLSAGKPSTELEPILPEQYQHTKLRSVSATLDAVHVDVCDDIRWYVRTSPPFSMN